MVCSGCKNTTPEVMFNPAWRPFGRNALLIKDLRLLCFAQDPRGTPIGGVSWLYCSSLPAFLQEGPV